MTTQEAEIIIDAHWQKYEKSCSPSIIEILLKLESQAPLNYYELQDAYQNQNIGLDFARNKTIKGLTFHQHDVSKEGSLANRISDELKARRFVGIYALDGNNNYHGWVVIGIETNGQLILRSKYSECGNGEGKRTAHNQIHISKIISPQVTDCVFYTDH